MAHLLLDRLEATQKLARRRAGRGGEEGTGFDGVRARCVLLAPTLYSPATIAPKDGYTQCFNLSNIR